MYNTRIAPSPTGDLHLGTARTAYFNWLAARSTGGKFILRIDDTDLARSDDAYVQPILDTFEWLGLNYDQLSFQGLRLEEYHKIANQLLESGQAIRVEGGAISLKIQTPAIWEDSVAGSVKSAQNTEEIIIIKSGGIAPFDMGMPTYNFATVVDDFQMGINYVIRGNDHLANTPKQIGIYNALNWQIPKFAHIGLIHYQSKKLSKRDQAASMLHYRDKGYDADAVLNFMLRLGWGPHVDDKTAKLIDRERALELFLNHGSMKPSESKMSMDLLESFDRKYKAQKGIWRNKDKLDIHA